MTQPNLMRSILKVKQLKKKKKSEKILSEDTTPLIISLQCNKKHQLNNKFNGNKTSENKFNNDKIMHNQVLF